MSKKIALFLFTTAVLMASLVVMSIPVASALTPRTDFNDNHTTARFGNSVVCGDHICAPGEHNRWIKMINDAQRSYAAGYATSGQHGEDVLHQLANAAQGTPVKSSTMTENMTMTGNMNQTGNMPNGMR